jgi:hypothetical protein
MDAALLYRNTDDFTEQRLCNQARFRVISGQRTEWASVPDDEVFSFSHRKGCCAPQFFEQVEGRIDSLGLALIFEFRWLLTGNAPSDLPHACSESAGTDPLSGSTHEMGQQWPVCLGENVFSIRGDTVSNMRPPDTGLLACSPDETIAFQASQMRTDGIVGHPKLMRELVHGAVLCLEQSQNLAARALEQPFPPGGCLHGTE